MEIKIDTAQYASESRRRKKKGGGNKRSQMLRVIMPHLSREIGDALADAIDKRSTSKFKQVWDKVKKSIVNQLATSESGDSELESISMEQLEEYREELLKGIESNESE